MGRKEEPLSDEELFYLTCIENQRQNIQRGEAMLRNETMRNNQQQIARMQHEAMLTQMMMSQHK